MDKYTRIEISVGLFLIAGAAILGYLSVSLGGLELMPREHYHIHARFASVGDLSSGAPVRIAGVRVGEVESIRLVDYAAEVTLHVEQPLELPADTIASIRTSGLLGESYVSLSPGGAEANMKDGDRVMQTEPAIDLIHLLSKYAFGGGGGGDGDAVEEEPF